MSVVHLTGVSAKNPEKFRSNIEDTKRVLLPGASFPDDDSKPIITSASDVAIIGAGFGGLASSVMLKRKLKTDSFVVFEKHANWGGTWWANTYPGCASDIPALWYSIYSELNDNWSDLRPPQYEMEEYILTVVEKYGLNQKAKFNTVVKSVVYNENTGLWKLSATNANTGQRYEHTAKVVFSCLGGLVYPNEVNIPGLADEYQGVFMHSALYDHSVDMRGKDVVVLGNGCSAAQLVPALMDDLGVNSVTQIFRSKHWIMPPLPAFLYTLYSWLSFSRLGLMIIRWIVILGAESRYPMYQGNSLFSRYVRWFNTWMSTRYIKSVAPEKYHDMLLPSYKVGCKRIIFDYKYVPSLKNPRFDLTNQRISRVTKNAVVLEDGTEVKADVIVACTGYNIMRNFSGTQFVGRDGIKLQDLWAKEGTSAYKTFMVKKFPNLILIGGPNSATGHSSVVTAIENGIAFASKVIPKVLDGEAKSVSVKESAYDRWFNTVQKRLKESVFGSEFGGCTSWYSENGVNATAYPYSQSHYWLTSRFFLGKDLEYESAESKKSI
ncbi:hypothetical protein OXX79_002399 [Metschnikowia pulcherrima]